MKDIMAFEVKRSRDGTITKAVFCDGVTHFTYDKDSRAYWVDCGSCGARKCRERSAQAISIEDLKTLRKNFQEDLGITISLPQGTVFVAQIGTVYWGVKDIAVSEFENGVLLNDGEYFVRTNMNRNGKYQVQTYYGNNGGRPVKKYLGKVGSTRARRRLNKLRGYGRVEIENTSYKAELYAVRTRKQELLQLPLTATVVKTLQLAEEAEHYLLSLPYEEVDLRADDIALSLGDEIQTIMSNVHQRVEARLEGRAEAMLADNPLLALESENEPEME